MGKLHWDEQDHDAPVRGGQMPLRKSLRGQDGRRQAAKRARLWLTSVLCALAGASQGLAQDALQANNPIAGSVSFNLQNEYIGNLSTIDESANIFNFRSVIPFQALGGDWVARVTVPVVTLPLLESTNPLSFGHETGLGDTNIFALRLVDTGTPTVSFGIGPSLTLPTATQEGLGADTYNLGLANVLFNFSNPQFQWGYLAVWETSVAKERGDAADVNRAFLQPFGIYQLGQGWYLRSTGVWNYDFETDHYSLPVGLGVGRVIPLERTVVNAFFEPQYAIASEGDGQREWGVFFGVNFQLR